MKKYILLFSMIAFMLITGCSTMHAKIKEPQGYKYKPPEVTQSSMSNIESKQILDAINNMGDRIVAAFNHEQQTAKSANGKKKPLASLFENKTKQTTLAKPADRGLRQEITKLKKQVRSNTKKINNLNKTAEIHGKEILLAQCKENDCAIDDIGLFPAGVTELLCSKKGCSLEKQIKDMVIDREEDDYVPFLVKGYTDDDGFADNDKISLKRAKSVKREMVVLRSCFKDIKREGESTRMFGTYNEEGENPNRRVRVYWKKNQ
ncbi:hypothetical protein KAJ61_05100 [Candidatus Parcubacteria bacterium]|nr:hypothetical protein [Candidatus Parcubacteria bacterium]